MKKVLSAIVLVAMFAVSAPVAFADSSLLNDGIFWNDQDYRLGINNSSPEASLHVRGMSTTTGETVKLTDLLDRVLFLITDWGDAFFGGTVKIGDGGAKVGGVYHATSTLDFPTTTILSPCDDLGVSVEAQPGDVVSLAIATSSVTGSSIFYGFVSDTDQVTVRHCSPGIVSNPASGEFGVLVTRIAQ